MEVTDYFPAEANKGSKFHNVCKILRLFLIDDSFMSGQMITYMYTCG